MCNDLFDIKQQNIDLSKGILLVSSPFSEDGLFQKSVVLLVEHDENGSLGFILNKQTDFKVEEVVSEIESFEAPVLMGGPVSPTNLFFIHRKSTIPKSYHIIGNTYWMGDFEALITQINAHLISPDSIRFFFGYSGWTKGQLEAEVKNNFWLLASSRKYDIWNDNNLWETILKDMGIDGNLLKTIPENPSLN